MGYSCNGCTSLVIGIANMLLVSPQCLTLCKLYLQMYQMNCMFKSSPCVGVARLFPARLGGWELPCDLNLNSTCPGQKAQGGPGLGARAVIPLRQYFFPLLQERTRLSVQQLSRQPGCVSQHQLLLLQLRSISGCRI